MTTGATDPNVGEALVLTCMDLRVTDDVARFFTKKGQESWWATLGLKEAPVGPDGAVLDALADEYDHIALAGSSLAAMGPAHPAWRETAWNHVGLAPKLHKSRRLIIVEHQDCGAYKKLLEPQSLRAHVGAAPGGKSWTNAKAEAKLHWLVASAMKKAVTELMPDWHVDILYAALDNPGSLHGILRPFTDEEKAYELDVEPSTVMPKREWLG